VSVKGDLFLLGKLLVEGSHEVDYYELKLPDE
jgi:hypothetical protein